MYWKRLFHGLQPSSHHRVHFGLRDHVRTRGGRGTQVWKPSRARKQNDVSRRARAQEHRHVTYECGPEIGRLLGIRAQLVQSTLKAEWGPVCPGADAVEGGSASVTTGYERRMRRPPPASRTRTLGLWGALSIRQLLTEILLGNYFFNDSIIFPLFFLFTIPHS